MKIGILTWESFGKEDMAAAFMELGQQDTP